MSAGKRVTIDAELWAAITRYHVFDDHSEATEQAIRRGVEAKYAAMRRRDLYSRSKTAESAQERENARQAYLDAAGVPDAFRWPSQDA